MRPNNIYEHNAMEHSYDRPMSITLISILLVIGGLMLLVTQLSTFSMLSDASSELGVSAVLLQTAFAFLGLLGVAAGIGGWFGKKWGWWLAVFYFAYAATRNANVLLILQGIDNGGAPADYVMMNYVKYGVRIVWNSLIILFLLRSDTVNSYFGTEDTSKVKAVLFAFGLSILLFVIASLVG